MAYEHMTTLEKVADLFDISDITPLEAMILLQDLLNKIGD